MSTTIDLNDFGSDPIRDLQKTMETSILRPTEIYMSHMAWDGFKSNLRLMVVNARKALRAAERRRYRAEKNLARATRRNRARCRRELANATVMVWRQRANLKMRSELLAEPLVTMASGPAMPIDYSLITSPVASTSGHNTEAPSPSES